ncbi:MAG: hypothetical protein M0Z60_08185 [Nitrospiraceae bacterium]|nr:hypothetical protein [Nitrospiraceae bacterium]
MKRALLVLAVFLLLPPVARGADDPLTALKDLTMAYFTPQSGTVLRVEGDKVVLSLGEKEGIRPGMRLRVTREGAPFVHPVTKEVIGTLESTVGTIAVKEVLPESSTGVMVEGSVKDGDRVRLSETKVKVFFCQDRSIDWYLADEYYRRLKATGRIEMIDTPLQTDDEAKVLAEAKKAGAGVALFLTGREAEKSTLMRERLYWVSDGTKFVDTEKKIDASYEKDLKFGEDYFTPVSGEAVTAYDLPFGARFILSADVEGNGHPEVVLSTGNLLRAYVAGADLKFIWEVKGASRDEFIWLDAVDINKDGRDEIVVTSLRDKEVVSSIYGFDGSTIKRLWEGNYFLRRLGEGLIAQAYSAAEGYRGDVFTVNWDGDLKLGEKLKVPKGVNIYDFVVVPGEAKKLMLFAYDAQGFLNLYDDKGLKVWRSGAGNGGFLTTFKRQETGAIISSSGAWTVPDRLLQRHREVLAVNRVPLAEMVKSIGYKKSQIRDYWWNGVSMEEGVLIDDIKGNIQDYALAGDKVLVLTSPFMGLKFENILKGESPLGVVLNIYSVKGR